MTAPVFYAPRVICEGMELDLEEAARTGHFLVVDGDEGKHAVRVHRLQPGEELDLVDGQGFRAHCEVAPAGVGCQSGLAVLVTGVLKEPESATELTLVQALAKGGRDEMAVEMATELGVDRIVPWQASRSIVRWGHSKQQKGVGRWERLATAAMKQSRRSRLPVVHEPIGSSELAILIREESETGALVLICHESATEGIRSSLEQAKLASVPPACMIVVGPEGGITDEEVALFKKSGAKVVLLGGNVLRSSTAGPSALVAANVVFGSW